MPSEPTKEMIEAFQKAWHLGIPGTRTRDGLRAVLVIVAREQSEPRNN